MSIHVKRHPASGEWAMTIPSEWWHGFEVFSRENRLPVIRCSSSAEGVTIHLPKSFSKNDIAETVGAFFDGIEELSFSE